MDVDAWSSTLFEDHVDITDPWTTSHWSMQSIVLDIWRYIISHPGEATRTTLLHPIEPDEIANKLLCVISKDASDVRKVIKYMQKMSLERGLTTYTLECFHVRCIAHVV